MVMIVGLLVLGSYAVLLWRWAASDGSGPFGDEWLIGARDDDGGDR